MFYLASFLLAIPSPIVFVINSEGWAAFVGLAGTRPWPAVALALAAGQTVCFVILYFGGERLLHRLPGAQRKLERFDRERYKGWLHIWTGTAALLGLPPMVLISALGTGLGLSLPALVGLSLAGRFVRFGALASVPTLLGGTLPVDWIPAWLQTLV